MNSDDVFDDLLFLNINNSNALNITSKKSSNQLICQNCNKSEFIIDANLNEKICVNCGYLLNNEIYDNLNIINYFSNETNDRCGVASNVLFPQASMSISMNGLTNQRLKNLHNWSAISYKERSLSTILNFINTICKNMNLLKYVIDDTKILYNLIIEYNNIDDLNIKQINCKKKIEHGKFLNSENKHKIITRGNHKLGIIGACIFYACKKSGYVKTIKEIATQLNITTACLNTGCKLFSRCIKKANIGYDINLSYPSQYVNNICNTLKVEPSYINDINNMIDKIEKNHLVSSHTPYSVALVSVIIYLESKQIEVSKKYISKIFYISTVTLHKTYDNLQLYKDYLLGYDSELKSNLLLTDSSTSESIDQDLKIKLENIKKININDYNNLTNIEIYDYVIPSIKNKSIIKTKIIDKLKFLC